MKYILIALIFFSCNTRKDPPGTVYSKQTLDTIQTSPALTNAFPAVFEKAFIKGSQEKYDKATVMLYGVTIGNLKVSTGRIIACDPMHIDEYGIPFTQSFPVGEFPVQLSVAKLEDEELIAFARISFSDEPVQRWELALLKDQDSLPVGGKKIHGYGVDGGVGIFIDEAAAKVFDKELSEDLDAPVFLDMNRNKRRVWKYTMYNFGDHNLAAFTTGFGDGRYATYIGYDAQGKPCRLITDFKIVNWKTE